MTGPDLGHLCFGFPVDHTPWMDEPFHDLVRRLGLNCSCDPIRLWVLAQELRQVARRVGTPLTLAEVGVWRGGSAKVLLEHAPAGSRLHLFDTFTGTPAAYVDGDVPAGKFKDTSVHQVRTFLNGTVDATVFHVGLFPATAAELPADAVLHFIHADANLYVPTRGVLDLLEPRLVRGGVIMFDDYGSAGCPGVRRAVDERLSGQFIYLPTGQALYRKE